MPHFSDLFSKLSLHPRQKRSLLSLVIGIITAVMKKVLTLPEGPCRLSVFLRGSPRTYLACSCKPRSLSLQPCASAYGICHTGRSHVPPSAAGGSSRRGQMWMAPSAVRYGSPHSVSYRPWPGTGHREHPCGMPRTAPASP